MLTLMNMLEEADAEPTMTQRAAVKRALVEFGALGARWNVMRTVKVPALNAAIRGAGGAATISP